MKAVVFSSFGPPEVLELADIPEPTAGRGEVRVRVKAAGVQSFETKLRRGDMRGYVPVQFPQRLGNEFAGIVDQVGPGADGFAVGDEVLGFTVLQADAEAIVVPTATVTVKPSAVGWEEAGALTAAGQTAWLALEGLGIGGGDTLLVHAAAGGVGTMAVQLARLRGATVIGTASEGNHDYLRSLGVIPVTYGPGLTDRVRELAPNGVDAALDAVGGIANQTSVEVVADRRRVGTVVDYGAVSSLGIRMLGGERTAGILATLAGLVADGSLAVEISLSVPLERAAEAHRLIETGHTRGRAVLTIG
jgi:enoyl reductase